MIRAVEIKEAAGAWGLRQDIVERDYVLGWLLAGLSAHPAIGTQWVFKGGTCLRKCYLETYRFSEDLDFSPTNDANLDPDTITGWVREVVEGLAQATGIEFPSDLVRFDARPNPRGGVTIRGKVGYRGPLGPRTAPKIRFDLTGDEVIALAPVLRPIAHPYSDRPSPPAQIRCYPIEEILAEKVRAMSERSRPRDLYDVVHIYRQLALELDRGAVREVLVQKCALRGLPFPTLALWTSSPSRVELAAAWASMLGHQLPALPPLESVWDELEAFFGWLESDAPSAVRV